MQYIISLNVWSRIKPISDRSRTKTAAIAYVTADAFVQFGAGDVLVTDASDNAIACGETSARVLEAAIARGAQIYSCEGLHAKVIVLDRVAVIGSSNLSDSSERRLVEAVWVTDDPTVIAEARSFVGRLAAQSRPIDRALLQRILSIKVARRLPTISNRRENLILDELRTDLDTTPPPAVDKELATQATPQPVVPVPPTPIQPKPPDPEIAGVLSRHVGRGGSTWVHDPQLVLMDRDEVGKLAGRLPVASIGQRVWARKADLGTPRQSDRSIPRPDYQILINALVALAEAKRAIPTEGEILDLVVARYKSGKYENKPSLELRKDPRRFYGQYFRAATEDSDSYGGKLKYLLHATPERAKVFIESLGVQTASR